MGQEARSGRDRKKLIDLEPIQLTPSEIAVLPFVFDISFNYRSIDRQAGFWEAMGLKTVIVTTGAGYALMLHEPEADS